jgi:hypothetical protein
MSLPEWGLYSTSEGLGDDPYYVQQIPSLVASHNFLDQSYFNSNNDNIPLIQFESNSFAAYKAAFDANGSSGLGTSW